MPIILAIEPDRRQAGHLAAIVRQRIGAELILADTTEGALDAIGSRVPDLVLVPALLSPQDDAALNAALRVIAAAAHVRTLTIPVFANGVEREERGGLLSRWRRGRAETVPDGCDPAVFAEQISEYLREAAADRAAESAARQRGADTADAFGIAASTPPPEPVAPSSSAATDIDRAWTSDVVVASASEAASDIESTTWAPEVAATSYASEPEADRTLFAPDPAAPTSAVADEPHVEAPPFVAFAASVDTDRADVADVVDVADGSDLREIGTEPMPTSAFDAPVVMHAAAAPEAQEIAAVEAHGIAPQAFDDDIEFAFAPAIDVEDRHGIAASGRESSVDAAAAGEDGDDDMVVIDLSEDIEEISPETPTAATAVFDGEAIGVYTMPSLDDDLLDFESDPQPLAKAVANVQVPRDASLDSDVPPGWDDVTLEPQEIAAFEDVDDAAATVAMTVPPPAVAIAAAAQPVALSAPPPPTVAIARSRDERSIAVGLRNVWAWPKIEGVTVEPAAAIVPIEEFARPVAVAPARTVAPIGQPPSTPRAATAVALPPPPPKASTPPQPKTDHMEWAELIASLRQDIERRRNQPMPAPPPPAQPRRRAPAAVVHAEVGSKRKSTPVQDEWGFFDPHQCGFAALLEKLDQITDTADDVDEHRTA